MIYNNNNEVLISMMNLYILRIDDKGKHLIRLIKRTIANLFVLLISSRVTDSIVTHTSYNVKKQKCAVTLKTIPTVKTALT